MIQQFIQKFRELIQKYRSIPTELKSGEPLKVGEALTKIFLLAIVVLAMLPQYTIDGGFQIRGWAFLLSPPNEIGDTFAGIAGVLAFLWIIVTVWLQSMELREQRKELQATREELKLTRETQQEQLLALKAQGDIFLDEQRQRQEMREREILNQRIALVVAKLSFFHGDISITAKQGSHFRGAPDEMILGGDGSDLQVAMLPHVGARANEDEVYEASLYFEALQKVLVKLEANDDLVKRSDGKSYFREIFRLFAEISDTAEQLSTADQYVIERLRIKRTRRVMGEILDLTIWEETGWLEPL